MKKILSIFITLVLVISCLPMTKLTAKATVSNDDIEWVEATGALTIKTNEAAVYTSIGGTFMPQWVKLLGGSTSDNIKVIMENVKSLTILEGVTKLEQNCFNGCNNLEGEVILPSTLTKVESYTLANTKITSLNVGGLTSIAGNAFRENANLEMVTLNNVISIGDSAFRNATNLKNIDLSKVKMLSASCFSNCTSLTSVNIGSATSVGATPFNFCTKINTVVMPGNITITISTNPDNCGELYIRPTTKTELSISTTDKTDCTFDGWETPSVGTIANQNAKTTTYTIGASNVNLVANYTSNRTLESIAITTPPTKTTYKEGESFDKVGMVVTATYTGSTGTVTSYTVSPSGALSTDDTEVTITYTENGVTKTTTQGITVRAVVYDISLSTTGTHTFTAATTGYAEQTPFTVIANNVGDATGDLNIALSGTNASSFTLSKMNIDSISVGGSDSFTIKPITGLLAGTYTATVTVSGNNGISTAFDVSFTVNGDNNNNNNGDVPTIRVSEVNVSVLDGLTKYVTANANMNNAFSQSVEVRLVDDAESVQSFTSLLGPDNGQIIAFDISLYIKDSNDKVQPQNGYAVTISIPLPTDLWGIRDSINIGHIEDGKLNILASTLVWENEMWNIVFETKHFSPYALLVGVDTNLPDDDQPQVTEIVQTGDSNTFFLWLGITLLSAMAVVVTSIRRKQKSSSV